MKAAIYSPYLDTLGGGERYVVSVAKILADHGYKVDIEWKDGEIRDKLEKRFGLSLAEVNFVENIKRGDGYDVCFWVSDGSIPLLLARKNFLHFQVPFKGVGGGNLITKMKLFRINKIICNSRFTKEFIDKEFGVQSLVLYPPVTVDRFKPRKKSNLICYVGRFSRLLQTKRQDILVKAFREFLKSEPDWKLILAGGVEVGGETFLEELKALTYQAPVIFLKSPDFKKIKSIYEESKFFWSASGFGIDEISEPQKFEHFGITVVEAMAAGAIPLVYDGGGHREIIENGKNGYLWQTPEGLVAKTISLINDEKKAKQISQNARKGVLIFSYERFEKEFLELL